MSMTGLVDVTPEPWSGRDDGPGAGHVRWHHVVRPLVADDPPAADSPAPTTIVGFASDEGVRRNKGRTGAATGPGALRRALAPMALSGPISVFDAGDVAVTDGELEAGQERLGRSAMSIVVSDTNHVVYTCIDVCSRSVKTAVAASPCPSVS
ncbi:hypothetical protein GSI01S_19_00410 [Gordonia sihwensis NBRC 108236]|uniref:Uncharacterized protein n=2 Tax=Gordoniaceae TaxID=85026 RepID=L7LN99_9ACTN|nr:hypothetical protein CXX93_00920 [Gordonia sp. YC-JH1]GAC61577.1 hypothetical protein GSI01S_19_00410 [Gordonia sihwensis NBRC 108236]